MNKMTAIADTVFGINLAKMAPQKESDINITNEQVSALLADIELACKNNDLSFYVDYDQVLNIHKYEEDIIRLSLLSNGVIINE